MTHIQGSTTQRDDFELAADFLLLTAPKHKELADGSQRISAVKSSSNRHGTNQGKTGIELRYYTKEEYKRLNRAQKMELSAWRKKVKTNDPNAQRVAALEQQLQEMRQQTETLRSTIASLTTSEPRDESCGPLMNPLTQRN